MSQMIGHEQDSTLSTNCGRTVDKFAVDLHAHKHLPVDEHRLTFVENRPGL